MGLPSASPMFESVRAQEQGDWVLLKHFCRPSPSSGPIHLIWREKSRMLPLVARVEAMCEWPACPAPPCSGARSVTLDMEEATFRHLIRPAPVDPQFNPFGSNLASQYAPSGELARVGKWSLWNPLAACLACPAPGDSGTWGASPHRGHPLRLPSPTLHHTPLPVSLGRREAEAANGHQGGWGRAVVVVRAGAAPAPPGRFLFTFVFLSFGPALVCFFCCCCSC